MFTTSTKLKLAYVGLAAVDTWLSGIADRKAHYARFVTKPLLMPTLAASLLTNPKAADSPLRTSTVAAQIGGWGGDVALLGEGTKPFLAGTGSFALGHAAYLRLPAPARALGPPRGHGPSRGGRLLGADGAGDGVHGGAAASRAGWAGLRLRHHARRDGRRRELPRHRPLPLGASPDRGGRLLFMASDTMLGFRKFVFTNPPPALETGVMATYTAAQFLLSEGAARA